MLPLSFLLILKGHDENSNQNTNMKIITALVTVLPINNLKDVQDLKARAGRVSAARREAAATKTDVSDTAKRTRVTSVFAPLATENVQDKYDVEVASLFDKLAARGIKLEALFAEVAAPVKQADKKAA